MPNINDTTGFKILDAAAHQGGYEREHRSEPSGENRGFDILRDERTSSQLSITLMKIDDVIMSHLINNVKLTVVEGKKQILVPVLYANAERWSQIRKDGVFRDASDRVQTPVVLFRRTAVARNPLTNPVNKHVDRTYSIGWNRHNSYDKFAVLNRIIPSKKLISLTIPDYVDLTYDFLLWTDYNEQMNTLIETLNFEMDQYWGNRNDFKFAATVDTYNVDITVPAEGDRYVKATFQMKVKAYLLPETMVDVDKGPQSTDRIRYGAKKVVIIQEIDGTQGRATVVEKWPAAGSAGTQV